MKQIITTAGDGLVDVVKSCPFNHLVHLVKIWKQVRQLGMLHSFINLHKKIVFIGAKL